MGRGTGYQTDEDDLSGLGSLLVFTVSWKVHSRPHFEIIRCALERFVSFVQAGVEKRGIVGFRRAYNFNGWFSVF